MRRAGNIVVLIHKTATMPRARARAQALPQEKSKRCHRVHPFAIVAHFPSMIHAIPPRTRPAEKKGRDHRRVIGNDFSSLLTHRFRRASERKRKRNAPVDRIDPQALSLSVLRTNEGGRRDTTGSCRRLAPPRAPLTRITTVLPFTSVHGEGSRAETRAEGGLIVWVRASAKTRSLGHCTADSARFARCRETGQISRDERPRDEAFAKIGRNDRRDRVKRKREKERKVNARKLTPSGVGYCWQWYIFGTPRKRKMMHGRSAARSGWHRMPPRACATVCPEGTTWTG